MGSWSEFGTVGNSTPLPQLWASPQFPGSRTQAAVPFTLFSKNTWDISDVLLRVNKRSLQKHINCLTGSILFCPFYSLCIPVGRRLKMQNSRYLKNFLFLMFSGAKIDRRLCTYGKGRKAGLFLGKKCFFHFLPSSMSVDINFKPGWHSTERRVKDLVLSSKKVSNRCSSNFKATPPSHLVPKRTMAFLAAQGLPYQMQQTAGSQSLTALF